MTINYQLRTPSFINPFDYTDHIAYCKAVLIQNKALQQEVKDKLEELWDSDSEHVAVVTTGSDGRCEKAAASKIELIVIHEATVDPQKEAALIRKMTEANPRYIWSVNERKTVGSQGILISSYEQNPKKLFPMRMMEAEMLGGDPNTFLSALAQQESEFGGSLGIRIATICSAQKMHALQTCRKGTNNFKGKTITHWDLEAGVAYYGGAHLDTGGAGSFKFGPLRAVQTRLAIDTIRYLNKVVPESHTLTLDDIPHNIPERLIWLTESQRTRRTRYEISDVADNYCFFLHWYHKSQCAAGAQKVSIIDFPRSEVKARLTDVVKLLQKPLLHYEF